MDWRTSLMQGSELMVRTCGVVTMRWLKMRDVRCEAARYRCPGNHRNGIPAEREDIKAHCAYLKRYHLETSVVSQSLPADW